MPTAPITTSAASQVSSRHSVDVITAWTVIAVLRNVASSVSQVAITIAGTGSDIYADAAGRRLKRSKCHQEESDNACNEDQ